MRGEGMAQTMYTHVSKCKNDLKKKAKKQGWNKLRTEIEKSQRKMSEKEEIEEK
jgi:hypothetical protein